MIIVNIYGGLGNQMFQYAYTKALEEKGCEVRIDISAFETYKLHGGYQLDKYKIDLNPSTQKENAKFKKRNFVKKVFEKLKIFKSTIVQEKSLLFDSNLFDTQDNSFVYGYFQSEKYFKNIRNILLKQFIINKKVSNYTKEIENKIMNSKNTCSLHIRRGDYVVGNNINIHGICDLEYYKSAIKFLEEIEKDISYFIFSDEIEWVKQHIVLKNAIYINSEEERIPHEDIYLMSLCKHNIIANSSFSWWGAWLNENKDKTVIAPKRWFADSKLEQQSKDIVCSHWIKI